ncbi:MAG: hypothetical protein ACP5NV_01285 [Candidatus Woesearchaeota archaeon]
MKKKILLTSIIFAALALALTIPFTLPTFAGTTALFNVSLTISNAAPTIVYVDAISDTPSEGTTKVVSFYFNASDSNGVADIPSSNALIKINRSGVTLTSAPCSVVGGTATVNRYQCDVTVNYYNLPGAWTINASIYDGAFATATNTSQIYTNGNVYGISLKTNSLTFSGSPGDNDVTASNNPQTVNNTGNNAITSLNITAYSLASGATLIGAGNFSANVSNNAIGQILANNTAITIASSSVAVQNSRDLYIFLDVPAGIPDGTYTSTSSWIVTMN